MKRVLATLSMLLTSALMSLVQAHHSFSMFDSDKTVTVDGTVTAFKWTMPHVWIYVDVPGDSGVKEWGMEAHSPNIAARKGWSSKSVKTGDKIRVTMHPSKSGAPVGSVIYVTLPDGKVLWNAESEART